MVIKSLIYITISLPVAPSFLCSCALIVDLLPSPRADYANVCCRFAITSQYANWLALSDVLTKMFRHLR